MAVMQVLSFTNTLGESQISVCVFTCLLLPGRNRCWLHSFCETVSGITWRTVCSGGSSLTILNSAVSKLPICRDQCFGLLPIQLLTSFSSPWRQKQETGSRTNVTLFLPLCNLCLYWHKHRYIFISFLYFLPCILLLVSPVTHRQHLLAKNWVSHLADGKIKAEGLQGLSREQGESVSNSGDQPEQVLPAHHRAPSPKELCLPHLAGV